MRRDPNARFFGSLVALALSTSTAKAHAGDWTRVEAMHTRRAFPTATPLLDGRVLVAGGITTYTNVAEASVKGVEIFDPTSNTWKLVGSMSKPRFEHCAARLADGRVLVAGGGSGSTDTVSAEIFDPTKNVWTVAEPMNAPRYWCTATLLDDSRVLVVGGLNNAEAIDTAELYDPDLDTWTNAPEMSISRGMHTATRLDDGRVLIAGGTIKFDGSGARKTAEIFDPSSNTWSPAGSMSQGRSLHTATRLQDGRVLIAGGMSNDGPTLAHASVEIFEPTTGTWALGAPMHGAHSGHAASILGNGRVLVAGGAGSLSDIMSPVLTSAAEVYDPAANAWIHATPMHDARDFFGASILPDGRVLVSGGSKPLSSGPVHDAAEIYFPSTGTLCSTSADCPSGFCVDGICCDTACDAECDACTRAAGATFDGTCAALPRDTTGSCTRACVSAHDCQSPLVCDPQGRCVAPPPDVSDFSGCRAGSRLQGDMPWWPTSVLLAAWVGRRVRRRARRHG